MRKVGEYDPLVADRPRILGYTNNAGSIGSKFLVALRDEKKFMGIRCPQCNHVYVPPRATCIKCFNKLDELVEVSDKGTLLTYTVVHEPEPVYPIDTPFIYGIVRLDGADTGLVHFIGECPPEKVAIGMKVQAVFEEKRTGSIKDIKYFKPI